MPDMTSEPFDEIDPPTIITDLTSRWKAARINGLLIAVAEKFERKQWIWLSKCPSLRELTNECHCSITGMTAMAATEPAVTEDDVLEAFRDNALRWMKDHHQYVRDDYVHIGSWNDAPGRKLKDVLEVLRGDW